MSKFACKHTSTNKKQILKCTYISNNYHFCT